MEINNLKGSRLL